MISHRTLALLQKIIDGKWTNSELVEFYNSMHQLCVNYLINLKNSGYHISKSGESLEDIAHDCVAPLFARDEAGFYYWRRWIESFGFPQDHAAISFFMSMVYKKTRQHLSALFKERDKIGAKVLRNVKNGSNVYAYVIKQGHIVHREDKDLPISKSETDFTYSRNGSTGNEVMMMLEAIPKNDHARALPIKQVVSMIKQHMIPGKRVEYAKEVINENKQEYEYIQISEDATPDPILKDVVHKAIDLFCQDPGNNKPWHENDYWIYAPVMKSYWDALLDGRYESMSSCFMLHFPGETYKQFRKNHRDQTDYLLKIVRERVKKYITN